MKKRLAQGGTQDEDLHYMGHFVAGFRRAGGLQRSSAAPPMTKTVDRNVEVSPPGTAFKLSPNAADEKRESEIPIAEDPPMEEETMASEPRRKTVFESLFQAVRNGAAEALDGEGTSPQR
jgi:hypothetical protein